MAAHRLHTSKIVGSIPTTAPNYWLSSKKIRRTSHFGIGLSPLSNSWTARKERPHHSAKSGCVQPFFILHATKSSFVKAASFFSNLRSSRFCLNASYRLDIDTFLQAVIVPPIARRRLFIFSTLIPIHSMSCCFVNNVVHFFFHDYPPLIPLKLKRTRFPSSSHCRNSLFFPTLPLLDIGAGFGVVSNAFSRNAHSDSSNLPTIDCISYPV